MRAQRGFTTVELLVAFAILVIVSVGVLELFDLNTRISEVQTEITDTQQALRAGQRDLVRTARMAGRGGLPIGTLPTGWAVSVRNDVPADSYIDPPTNDREILEGTDVLTVRGAISSPVYMIVPDSFSVDLVAGRGRFELTDVAQPGLPVPQDLGPLADAITDGVPAPLVLVSPLDDSIYHVVELDPAASSVADPPTSATIWFYVTGGVHTAAYWGLSGNTFDPALESGAAYVGILEEHRYYVRETRAVAGDDASDLEPVLSRARFFPGTDLPYPSAAAEWDVEIADDVVDLQIALGIDTADGGPADGLLVEDGTEADEWLFNSPDDDPAEPRWLGTGGDLSHLFYLRISTVAATERRDRTYQAPLALRLEDRVYPPGSGVMNAPDRRPFRRRTLQTLVDMRNIT